MCRGSFISTCGLETNPRWRRGVARPSEFLSEREKSLHRLGYVQVGVFPTHPTRTLWLGIKARQSLCILQSAPCPSAADFGAWPSSKTDGCAPFMSGELTAHSVGAITKLPCNNQTGRESGSNMALAASEAAEIRPRQPSDVPALLAALEDVYRTDGYPVEGPSGGEAFISPPGLAQAWVAVRAGAAVGQVAVVAGAGQAAVRAWVDHHHHHHPGGGGGGSRDAARAVVVARFFVRRDARRLGLGRRLVERACAWARDRGMVVVMNVMSKDVDAMRLYERIGFRRIGEGEYQVRPGEVCLQYFYVYENGLPADAVTKEPPIPVPA